jgi:hypothetical protein
VGIGQTLTRFISAQKGAGLCSFFSKRIISVALSVLIDLISPLGKLPFCNSPKT